MIDRNVRSFFVMVDSGSHQDPPNRYLGTLAKARAVAAAYPDHFQPHIWIGEWTEEGNVRWHVRNGQDKTP